MRLVDLNPYWVGSGGEGVSDSAGNPVPRREGVAIICDCPCGKCGRRLCVPFRNPLESGPAAPSGWTRSGDTFEDLTLDPSIKRTDPAGCMWHGFLRAGVFISC